MNVRKEFLQIDFAGNPGQHERHGKDRKAYPGMRAFRRDRSAIVRQRTLELFGRRSDDDRGHRAGPGEKGRAFVRLVSGSR